MSLVHWLLIIQFLFYKNNNLERNIDMKKILIFVVVVLFNGCAINGIPNIQDYANGWIGSNIDGKLEAHKRGSGSPYVRKWQDNKINQDYYLSNGNLVHVYPEREGCIIHWEVDKSTNRIIGYKLDGDRCY
jgi:hypothetical protein